MRNKKTFNIIYGQQKNLSNSDVNNVLRWSHINREGLICDDLAATKVVISLIHHRLALKLSWHWNKGKLHNRPCCGINWFVNNTVMSYNKKFRHLWPYSQLQDEQNLLPIILANYSRCVLSHKPSVHLLLSIFRVLSTQRMTHNVYNESSFYSLGQP